MTTEEPSAEEMARRVELARAALDSLPKAEDGTPILIDDHPGSLAVEAQRLADQAQAELDQVADEVTA